MVQTGEQRGVAERQFQVSIFRSETILEIEDDGSRTNKQMKKTYYAAFRTS